MKKLLFIANPKAGRMCFFSGHPVRDFIKRIENELTGWDIRVLISNDARDLRNKLSRYSADSVQAIFALGGDGTLNRSIDSLLSLNRSGVPIGILPAGTANDFARQLGMELTVDCIARTLAQPTVQPVDLIRVNGAPLMTVGGTGIGSLLLDQVESARQGRGKILMGLMHRALKSELYSLLAINSVLRANIAPDDGDSVTYRLRATSTTSADAPSHVIEFRTSSMFVCNQGVLGSNLLVSPSSSPSDGVFEMLAFQGVGRVALLNGLLDFKRGRELSPAITLRARSLLLEEMDGRPISFFGDGEILRRDSRLEFELEPGALKVLRLPSAPQTVPLQLAANERKRIERPELALNAA